MQPDFLGKTPAKNWTSSTVGARWWIPILFDIFSEESYETYSSLCECSNVLYMIFRSPVTDEGDCVFSKHKNGTARMVETMSSWHNSGRSIAKRPKRSPNVRLTCIIIAAETLDCSAEDLNLFTTIHDGNFRRHSSMNVTIKWHKFSSNIYYIYVFFVIWSWKLR